MFDLPAAKRVRRADLYSPPRSPPFSSPDPDLTALLQSQLSQVYGPALPTPLTHLSEQQGTDNHAASAEQDAGSRDADAAEGFEFRLFASSRAREQDGTVAVTKIVLDDESEARERGGGGGGGFVVPERSREYYFTDAMAPARREEERERLVQAAVSGEDVRRWLGTRHYGWEVGWRVRRLRMRNGELVAVEGVESERAAAVAAPLAAGLGSGLGREGWMLGDERKGKGGKPGKKRRIVLRVRRQREEQAAERRREEESKKEREEQEREEREREKRTRRNREKKVKRKMREKTKKMNGEGGGLGITKCEVISEGE